MTTRGEVSGIFKENLPGKQKNKNLGSENPTVSHCLLSKYQAVLDDYEYVLNSNAPEGNSHALSFSCSQIPAFWRWLSSLGLKTVL